MFYLYIYIYFFLFLLLLVGIGRCIGAKLASSFILTKSKWHNERKWTNCNGNGTKKQKLVWFGTVLFCLAPFIWHQTSATFISHSLPPLGHHHHHRVADSNKRMMHHIVHSLDLHTDINVHYQTTTTTS